MLAKVKPKLIDNIEFIVSSYDFTYKDLAKNILFNTEQSIVLKKNEIAGQLYFQNTNIENVITDGVTNYGVDNLEFKIILTNHSNVKYIIEKLYIYNINKNKIEFIGSFQCKYNFGSINDLINHLTIPNIEAPTTNPVEVVEIPKYMKYLDILE